MGVFTCQICGELDSYEYDELLQELRGQASDGWGESFEQHEIHTSEGDIYVSFYDTCGAWELMTEEEVKAAPESPSEDTVQPRSGRRIRCRYAVYPVPRHTSREDNCNQAGTAG